MKRLVALLLIVWLGSIFWRARTFLAEAASVGSYVARLWMVRHGWYFGPGAHLDERYLEQALAHERYETTLRLFAELKRLGEPSPVAYYEAGLAAVRLHRWDEAETLLSDARRRGFLDFADLPSIASLHERVATLKAASPPRLDVPGLATISVYADPADVWTKPLLDDLPRFEAVGRRIFGRDPPPVSFYLFRGRDAYDRFCRAFDERPRTTWDAGRSDAGFVLFFEPDPEDKRSRPAGSLEELGAVLHEFGHAWTGAYVRSRYDKSLFSPPQAQPWFYEGLAEYIASAVNTRIMRRRADQVAYRMSFRNEPPPFDDLKTTAGFYSLASGDAPRFTYWLSTLLFGRVLGAQAAGLGLIPGLLDAAAKSGDDVEALKAVLGVDARQEYDALVREGRKGAGVRP